MPLEPPPATPRGEFRVNPLYVAETERRARSRLRLRFPSEDYEQEYGACRQYLPDATCPSSRRDRAALAAGARRRRTARRARPPPRDRRSAARYY